MARGNLSVFPYNPIIGVLLLTPRVKRRKFCWHGSTSDVLTVMVFAKPFIFDYLLSKYI